MNNYRVTFLHNLDNDVKYWNNKGKQAESSTNFKELVKYHPLIEEILSYSKYYNIEYIWWFFEPHIELTFLCDFTDQAQRFIDTIKEILEDNDIEDYKIKTPADGNFAEWYSKGPEEELFGAKRYGICADWILNYLDNKDCVDNGKTLRKQVERTIHGLCNPLGFNYVDEAKICFSRGLICILFRYFSFDRALWIYRNIFRQVY